VSEVVWEHIPVGAKQCGHWCLPLFDFLDDSMHVSAPISIAHSPKYGMFKMPRKSSAYKSVLNTSYAEVLIAENKTTEEVAAKVHPKRG
jgi:hypothetical protein